MRRRHSPPVHEDEILHDFDARERILRILFVGPGGDLTPVKYRLCPKCGVSMELSEMVEGRIWTCGICGTQIDDPTRSL